MQTSREYNVAADRKKRGSLLKGVLLDGSLHEKKDVSHVGRLLTSELEAVGCELSTFELWKIDIAPCQGCFGCWIRTPGECLIQDESKDIVRAFTKADLLVLLTPVTFGGYSSELKKALDRGICFVSPFFMTVQGETHHKPRYDRSPRLLGVGVAIGEDQEAGQIFRSLVRRNALNFHSPAFSTVVVGADDNEVRICSELRCAISELELQR